MLQVCGSKSRTASELNFAVPHHRNRTASQTPLGARNSTAGGFGPRSSAAPLEYSPVNSGAYAPGRRRFAIRGTESSQDCAERIPLAFMISFYGLKTFACKTAQFCAIEAQYRRDGFARLIEI